jgi:hypothetical protein
MEQRLGVAMLYLVAFWLPLQYLPTRTLGLLPLGFVWVDDFALLVAALLGAAHALRVGPSRLRSSLWAPLVGCAAVGIASALANGVGGQATVLCLRGPLQPVLAYFALKTLEPSLRDLRRLGLLCLGLALLQAPVAAVQFAVTRDEMSRDFVFGTFWKGASNSMAYYLFFFILPLAALASEGRRWALSLAAVLLVPFVLASSRGAYLCLPPLLIVAIWPALRARRRTLYGLAALGAAAAIAFGLFYAYKPKIEGSEIAGELNPWRLVIEQFDRQKGMGRLYYARWAGERMAERGLPGELLGLGPAAFSSAAGAYLGAPLLAEATRGGHSPIVPGQLIAIGSELGLAGLLAFGWLVLAGLRNAGGASRAGLTRGLFAATLFLIPGTVLENVWELPHVATLAWAAVALCEREDLTPIRGAG